jgi:hypothetical protein
MEWCEWTRGGRAVLELALKWEEEEEEEEEGGGGGGGETEMKG